MRDLEYCDQVGELRLIREAITEMKGQLVEIRRINRNMALMLEVLTEKVIGEEEHKLPEMLSRYMDKKMALIRLKREHCAEWSAKLAKKAGARICYLDHEASPGELAAKLNGCKEGDYLFIDYVNIAGSRELEELILDSVANNCIHLTIGRGDSRKNITLDLPELNYIIYSPVRELISEALLEKLDTVIE